MPISSQNVPPFDPTVRVRVVLFLGLCVLGLIFWKLFYWQVSMSPQLTQQAQAQYLRTKVVSGTRGKIYSSDGFPLVLNTTAYSLVAHPHQIELEPQALSAQLAIILSTDPFVKDTLTATSPADTQALQLNLAEKLSKPTKWVRLSKRITTQTKQQIEALQLQGITFETFQVRSYPEASMAAQTLGFVGKTSEGEDIGYFGVEGSLESLLKKESSRKTVMADARGYSLLSSEYTGQLSTQDLSGRDVYLTIRRDIQFIAEQKLHEGVKKYGAKSGEIVIMDAENGHILALASEPKYDPATFFKSEPQLFKNPSVIELYEPGSTFKVLTLAAGIDAGVIGPHTPCPNCQGPRVFDTFTIKTWNNQYNPNISMTDALAKSDNIAMIFVAEKLGAEKMLGYLKAFGIGEPLHISLQEDRATPFPEKVYPVELATISFGQGINSTSLQLVRAISAIANKGTLLQPTIIKGVMNPETQQIEALETIPGQQVIKPETAATMTQMMMSAAQTGEAKWTTKRDGTVAGKTGTSQIPIKGGYKDNATIATYVGFKPAAAPKFIMLVKLTEPQSSPWAAETAAPLWYDVAQTIDPLL